MSVKAWLAKAGADLLVGIVAGVAAATTLAFCSYLFRDWLQSEFAVPSCETPTGLVQVSNQDIQARGPAMADQWAANNAVDGYPGSLWIPPLAASEGTHQARFRSEPDQRTLELRLEGDPDVELVCVNNGLANSATNFVNWGRVRTVEVWTPSGDDRQVTTLQAFPGEEMLTMQTVAKDLGTVDVIHLQVNDAYSGITVETFDPDLCGQSSERVRMPDGETAQLRFEQGCLRAAVPKAGISEVVVFAKP